MTKTYQRTCMQHGDYYPDHPCDPCPECMESWTYTDPEAPPVPDGYRQEALW